MSPSYELPELSRHVVTAVLVAHDGARWLPRTLEGLRGQSRPVQRAIAVDTGSGDTTPTLLADALGAENVVTRPRNTGFGAAITYALNAYAGGYYVPAEVAAEHLSTEIVEWVWLLHDDSEPAPDALYHLLALAEEMPSAAVVGAKIRGWYDRRQLLEVGVSMAPNGRRETGLDRREQDQGQHDDVREALAVSSAGMLVKREVWDQLRGFDRTISLMHDDIDFCWRANAAGHHVVVATGAVVYHAEAASRERREVDTRRSRAHFADRANGMYVLLVNSRGRSVPPAMVRLGVGAVLRAIGMLVAKLPGHAADEVLAALAVYSRPDRLLRGRRHRHKLRQVQNSELRPLFPPRGSQLRRLVENVAGVVASSRNPDALSSSVGRHRAIETGPGAEETEDMVSDGLTALRRFFLRPGVLLMLGLSLLSLVAFRELIGGGRLMGGALLPSPSSASSLWSEFTSSWHSVGLGSGAHAPPYLVVVAALGTLFVGNASIAIDLIFLGCLPLAGITAYLAASMVVRARSLRMWAAATYALLPAATGALAAGRLGTTVGVVLLPLIGIGAARVIGTGRRPGSMRVTWATGLVLSVATAFVPLAWVLAVLLTGVAAGTVARSPAVRRRLLVVLVTPMVLLLPWSLSLLRHPSTLLLEAGLPGPGLSDLRLNPLALVLLHPSGPGMYPLWISAGLLLAALAALLRDSRREVVLVGWTLGLTGFVVAMVMSRIDVQGPRMAASAPAWPGFATAVMGAGLILAALIGGEGVRSRLAASSFGWRQPISLGVTALAAVTPVLAGLWWAAQGAGDPLERRNPVVLPAYVAAEGETPDRPRTLVLRPSGDGALSYAVLRNAGPRLGDGDTSPENGRHQRLDQVVASIGSGQAREEVRQLADYAIQYVLVARPVDPALARTLDGVPGLARVSTPDGAGLWRLPSPAARLRLLGGPGGGTGGGTESRQSVALPSGAIAAKTSIPPGGRGRVLALAETADPHWRASLDGERLVATTANGWEQAFEVPAQGGVLRVWHDGTPRTAWIFAEGFLALVAVVLVLPGGRRDEDEDEEIVHDVVEEVPRSRSRRAAEPAPEPAPESVTEPAPASEPVTGTTPPITEPEPVPGWQPEWQPRSERAPERAPERAGWHPGQDGAQDGIPDRVPDRVPDWAGTEPPVSSTDLPTDVPAEPRDYYQGRYDYLSEDGPAPSGSGSGG